VSTLQPSLPEPDGRGGPSDEALLARVRDGDTGAHRELFGRYAGRVYGFVLRRVEDPALAEEIAADVFFEVWRSAARFRGDSRVSTWLFGIAHFKARAATRRQRSGIRGVTRLSNVEALHRVPDRSDPVRAAEARGELRRLAGAMEALPPSQREVVELVFGEGMAYAEAARRLGVPEATVKTRVSRARSRLRRDLDPQRFPG